MRFGGGAAQRAEVVMIDRRSKIGDLAFGRGGAFRPGGGIERLARISGCAAARFALGKGERRLGEERGGCPQHPGPRRPRLCAEQPGRGFDLGAGLGKLFAEARRSGAERGERALVLFDLGEDGGDIVETSHAR
ncbi:MAG TPA: hypothetical protein VNV39_01750 [Stellaceae bacterium]|nr:hypothetical protein [Stellaceae bacterium]